MTDTQRAKCHAIIHGATAACAAIAGGMAQIPGSDAIPITGIQVGMIISLGAVFDIPVSESGAKGIMAGLGAAAGGRLVSQFLVGWIPGFGNAINASTAVAITEGLGWKAADYFDEQASKRIEA